MRTLSWCPHEVYKHFVHKNRKYWEISTNDVRRVFKKVVCASCTYMMQQSTIATVISIGIGLSPLVIYRNHNCNSALFVANAVFLFLNTSILTYKLLFS